MYRAALMGGRDRTDAPGVWMLRRWPGGVALAAALGALLLPVGSLAVFFISQSVVALIVATLPVGTAV